MADRQVTRSRKDRDGDILALCNRDELSGENPQTLHPPLTLE